MDNFLTLLKSPYFKVSQLEALLPYLKRPSLYQKISRWVKKGEIIQLKKGVYTLPEYVERNGSNPYFYYYLANILRYPSYVSGVYILQSHGVLTDITYPVTSVTLKSSRKYSNRLGEFVYHSISPKLYIGYSRFFYKDEPVYAAAKAKALFDYLYLKYFKIKIEAKSIKEKERLNLNNFTALEIKEFKKYCQLSNNRLLICLSAKLFYE